MRLEQQVRPGHSGGGQLTAEVGVGERIGRRLGQNLGEAEKVALDRGRVGISPPEVDQVGHRLEGLAALAKQLADPRVLEVAGLDQPAPDDDRPLVLVDVAIGPADDQQLVEAEDQLGGLFLDHLEVLDHLAGLIVFDVDEQQHPRGVLGHVVAQRVAGEQRLERRGRLGVAAGVEMRLAASVELVGRLAIRIGVLFSRGQNLELTGLAQVELPRLIGALDRGRQRAVLAGKVAVNVVLDAAGVLVRVRSRT